MTSACVSPRVNTVEPCARGSTPFSIVMGRISVELAAVEADALVEHLACALLLHGVEGPLASSLLSGESPPAAREHVLLDLCDGRVVQRACP